jgi:hypothetical protein
MFAAAVEKWIVADHKRAGSRLGQDCKRAIDVAFGARIQGMKLQPEGMAAALRSLKHARSDGRPAHGVIC